MRADLDALDEVLVTTPRRRWPVEPAVRGADRAADPAAVRHRRPRRRCPSAPGSCTACASAGLGAARRRPGHPPDRPRRSRRPSWTWPGGARSSSRSSPRTPRSPATTAPRSAPCPPHYATLDRAHVDSLSGPVLGAVVGHVAHALRQHREQAEALFADLVEERLTSLRDTVVRHPDVARRLRPVIAASPMLVPQVLPPTRTVDLVVLDSAAHLPVEVALAAIARGRQVVVVGDARCASSSAVRELADVLPSVALRADCVAPRPVPHRVPRRPRLRRRAPPDARCRSTGRSCSLDVVDGTGMPDRDDRDQSTRRATRSSTSSSSSSRTRCCAPTSRSPSSPRRPTHAEAVREAVLVRGPRRTPRSPRSSTPAASSRSSSPTCPTSPACAARRSSCRSAWAGPRTAACCTPSDPSPAPAATRCCSTRSGPPGTGSPSCRASASDDLDPERLRGPGPRLLADLLAFAARRGAGQDVADLVTPPEPTDPLLRSLAVATGRRRPGARRGHRARPPPARPRRAPLEARSARRGRPRHPRWRPDPARRRPPGPARRDARRRPHRRRGVHRRAQRPRPRPAHRRPPRARRLVRHPRLVRRRVHRPAGRGGPHPPRRARPCARTGRAPAPLRCSSA